MEYILGRAFSLDDLFRVVIVEGVKAVVEKSLI